MKFLFGLVVLNSFTVSPGCPTTIVPWSKSIFFPLGSGFPFLSLLVPKFLARLSSSESLDSIINPIIAFITAACISAFLYLPSCFIGYKSEANIGTPLLCPILSGSNICKIFLLPKELNTG